MHCRTHLWFTKLCTTARVTTNSGGRVPKATDRAATVVGMGRSYNRCGSNQSTHSSPNARRGSQHEYQKANRGSYEPQSTLHINQGDRRYNARAAYQHRQLEHQVREAQEAQFAFDCKDDLQVVSATHPRGDTSMPYRASERYCDQKRKNSDDNNGEPKPKRTFVDISASALEDMHAWRVTATSDIRLRWRKYPSVCSRPAIGQGSGIGQLSFVAPTLTRHGE